MNFTFYGHACFSVELMGKKLLFDPFISPNELANSIDINTIEADYIFISHGHQDHIADAETIAKRTGATIIAGYEVAMWLAQKGLEKYHPMNTGGEWQFDFGVVKCIHAVHSSCLPDGSYGGNPMGFLIKTNEKNFYYSGDTALTTDMQLIPAFATIDCALLCIGDNFTMGYKDAARAAHMIGCKKIIGVHFDTFGFIKINHEQAKAHFNDEGLNLILPSIGQTINI